MPIGRKKKYKRHHRRDNKESSNENGGDPPTPPPTHNPHLPTQQPDLTSTQPPRSLHRSTPKSSSSNSCQPLPSPSSPCRSPRMSSPPMTRKMKREDEADEIQWRQMIAGYCRLILNNPPERDTWHVIGSLVGKEMMV
jgi:hypothetical protein